MAAALAERTDLVRFIDDVDGDGHADRPLPDCIDAATAVELYRRMVLLRTYDERSLVYHRHGRIGTYAIYWGHEAMQVGAVSALDRSDWVLPSYRESAVGLMRDMSATTILAWWRGHPDGWWDPREFRIGSVSVPVGSHVPHAVGCAWGERLQGRNSVALAFFGDGATSEGDFHEGANMAAVLELPVILLCNNNGWAITTPISKQTKAEHLADKAVGYGMHSVRVDGNDVLAVYQAVHEAAERGRAGDGPTFIEAVSYRPTLHATADDVDRYRDDHDAAVARHNNCLDRYEQYLLRQGLIETERIERFRQESLDLMADAIVEAEALPAGGVSDVFDTVYAEAPPWFARDAAELEASRGAAGGGGEAR
jgi:pyruvate dehydrogenase E1 component alpha subunit